MVRPRFDLLHLDGRDVSALPLLERKSLLERVRLTPPPSPSCNVLFSLRQDDPRVARARAFGAPLRRPEVRERDLREANSVPLDLFRSAKADNSAVESTFLFCLNQREDDVATSSGSAARRLRGSMT